VAEIPQSAEPVSERELVIERVFDVPRRILFKAYADPQYVRQWFGPPGYPLTLCEMNFRVGGRYRYAMTGPDGKQNTPFGGEYLAIVPDSKIVYTNTFEEAGAQTMVFTFSFDESEGKTTLTLHVLFASAAMKKLHVGHGFEQGMGAGFEQLAAVAAELARA